MKRIQLINSFHLLILRTILSILNEAIIQEMTKIINATKKIPAITLNKIPFIIGRSKQPPKIKE